MFQLRITLERIRKHRAKADERKKILESRLRVKKKDSQEEEDEEEGIIEGSLVTPERREILDMSLRMLLFKLRKGEIKSKEVLEAYQVKNLFFQSQRNIWWQWCFL